MDSKSKGFIKIPCLIYTLGKLGGEFENNIQFLGCTMVLISDGCTDHVAQVRRFFLLLCKNTLKRHIYLVVLNTCTTYSKQPFHSRTMVCNYLVYQSALQSLTRSPVPIFFLTRPTDQPSRFL